MDFKKLKQNIEFYGLAAAILVVGGNFAFKKFGPTDEATKEKQRQEIQRSMLPDTTGVVIDLHKAFLLNITEHGDTLAIQSPNELSLEIHDDSIIVNVRTVSEAERETHNSRVFLNRTDAAHVFLRNKHDLDAVKTGTPYLDTANVFVPLSKKMDTIRFKRD